MFDGQQLGETIVAQVKGFLEREVAPLKAENAGLKTRVADLEARPAPDSSAIERRLDELEARPAPEKGDPGEPGQPGERGEDGTSVTIDDLAPIISEQVSKAVAEAIPAPEPGLSTEHQSALTEHFLRKALGDTTTELPALVEHKADPEINVQVDVHTPPKGAEKTIVTKRDEQGRVEEFERREV